MLTYLTERSYFVRTTVRAQRPSVPVVSAISKHGDQSMYQKYQNIHIIHKYVRKSPTYVAFELLYCETYYFDGDGDGFGIASFAVQACSLPTNFALVAGDCDDSDEDVNPAAMEIPNDGIDNDCMNGDSTTVIPDCSQSFIFS